MALAMAQMNTRIDADLKQRGDAALKRAGYTPSQAVRALWEFAAAHVHEPEVVAQVLSLNRNAPDADADKGSHDFEEGLQLVKTASAKLGIRLAFDFEEDDATLLEEALHERFGECHE